MALTKVSYSMIAGTYVNAIDYGAKGDGTTNDTAAIQAANDAAAAVNANLFIPAGTYICNALTASTSWFGEKDTLIKYAGTAYVSLITATSIDNITFSNLTVDGNCSADPVTWNASNYNSFTGSAGITIVTSDNAKIINCNAQNNVQHGFKTDSCTNAIISGCTTNRNRGKFGDGFFNANAIDLKIVDCKAYDFTRIGFVVDTYGDNPKTSYNIAVSNCIAQYGHDGSTWNGDQDYNAGLWCENTAHVQVNNFTAIDISEANARGITLCSGVQNNGVVGPYANYQVVNARFENTTVGLQAYSLETFPVSLVASNIQASKTQFGVSFTGNLAADNFVCSNSHVDLDFTISGASNMRAYDYNVAAGLSGQPTITFSDCSVSHTSENLTLLNNYGTTTSTADIGSFIGFADTNGARLTIDNCVNTSGGLVWVGIPYLQRSTLGIISTAISIANSSDLGTGTIDFQRCSIAKAIISNSASVRIKDCVIYGQLTVGSETVQFENNRVYMTDSSYVWLQTTATGKKPGIVVSGCYFEKDINTNGYVLRNQFGSVSNTAIVSDSQFYNSGSASASNPFMVYAAGQQTLFTSVFKDSTVTNMIDIDTGGAPVALPTGCTSATFH